MRVLFDHSVFSLQEHGGISRYFCELAAGLAGSEGIDPCIVAPLHVSRLLRRTSLPVRGWYMPRIARTHRLRQMANNLLSPFLCRGFTPDIVHHTYYLARTRLPAGIPRVVTVFDMIHERFPELMAPGEEMVAHAKSRCVRNADHVICISRQTRRDVVEILGIAPEKTSVVYLASSLGRAGAVSGRPLARRPYLLYVGERSGPKNFDRLLQAYARSGLPAAGVRLVCFGGPPVSGPEHQRMRALGCGPEQVVHMGGDDSVLENLYRHALALVYPSLYEGFGLPLLEAMACDCPVLCSGVSSMPEVAGNAAWFFDPADVEDMMQAMETIAGSAQQRETLVSHGRERLGMFSWQRCVQETIRVYERCLQG